ncbi:hypothetical protein ACS0TY_034795 [Phlomoides rotata]
MAIFRRKGKLIFVLLTVSLLVSDLFSFPRFSCLVLASELDPSSNCNSVIETSSENDYHFREKLDLDYENSNPDVLLRKQQFQLDKLQELVQNLKQLVSRLESRVPDAPKKLITDPPPSSVSTSSYHDAIRDLEKIKPEESAPSKEEGAGWGAGVETVAVKKYNSLWSERFQFVSAVKLRSNPNCVNVLPFRDFEGLSKYFAVGDDKGRLYVFLRSGDVALEFDSEEPFPITAIVSYLSLYKNESTIITGHENGAIVMHRVWETLSGEEWSLLHVEKVGRFELPESGGSRINMLEVHHVGRRRYILATDSGGRIIVFKEDGTLYGSATPSRQPIAFLKQRLLFLTENGAGSLDLRTMKLKETECEGFNGSTAISYVFDAMDRSKAYGLTLEGDLVQTLLLGDVMNFKCRVRSKRKLDLDEPIALQAIKGYLVISNREKVFVYNVSSQHYVRAGGVRLLFSAGHNEIIAAFLNQQAVDVTNESRVQTPFITTDHEKLVIISLGNGYVSMYRSNLPVFKNEFNSLLWTSPVLFFILFLFGAWHFFANKKEALTSWGPDDPFNSASVTSGAPLGSGAGDRSFTESSRSSEIMEIRGGGGLRGSSRYVSPPRYPGGSPNPYRPGPDTDPRPGSNPYRPGPDTDSRSDPRFRANSELKYRGSNVEAAGVPKRRDPLFVNSQVVDENN